MILDRLENCERYASLHSRFAAAFEWLRSRIEGPPAEGRHELDGDRLFVLVARDEGRSPSGAKLEAHRRYIDIQLTLPNSTSDPGSEVIGWRALSDCRELEVSYDERRDIMFFADAPTTWLTLPAGTFAVFYPDDAHAPLAGQGPVLKAVVKIAVSG